MQQKPYHHGNLRADLIEAGIKLVREQGLTNFSMRKLAAKCGVSHAAPYAHFTDVDDLVRAMGKYVTERFTEKLRASVEGREGSEALMLLGRAYVEFFVEHPQYFSFLFYYSGMIVDIDHENPDEYPPFAVFRETACRLFRRMNLPESEYARNLAALWSMVHGAASLLTNDCIRYGGDWRDIVSSAFMRKEIET